MAAFTTIATAAGLAISAAGTTGSFIQAGKQRKRQEEAERLGKKAFDESKDTISTLYEGERSIQKEKYNLAREAGLSGLGQIVQAGQEGEQRGVIATAGKANIFNQQQQARTRIAMGEEMSEIEKAQIREKQRVRNALANIGLQEARGQQMIAADARAARQAANQAGVSGLMSLGTQAMKLPGLYGSSTPATGEAGMLDFVSDKGNMDALSAISARVGENPSFSDIFGPVSAPTNFDPNSVQVLEEDLDPIVIN
tara:strand:- start:742 stop:1503 length:762 start_codon:yes stop_codon:yes gene_type:complete